MPCVAGLLVQKELFAFSQVLDPAKRQRPLTAIVGGAKISDKILVIENLIDKCDRVMCIGGMARRAILCAILCAILFLCAILCAIL